MTQATDQDIRELKTAIDTNSKAITDLVASVGGLREEMRVGFSDIKGDMKVLDTRLGNLESRMNGLESSAQKVSDLAEKVGELKNWKQIAIVVFIASVSSAIAWFLRGGKI
jgi:predicted RNase H-like nuclease (RuvC/YqgF family)